MKIANGNEYSCLYQIGVYPSAHAVHIVTAALNWDLRICENSHWNCKSAIVKLVCKSALRINKSCKINKHNKIIS